MTDEQIDKLADAHTNDSINSYDWQFDFRAFAREIERIAFAEERERCKAFIENEIIKMHVLAKKLSNKAERANLHEYAFLLGSVSEKLFPEPTEKGVTNA